MRSLRTILAGAVLLLVTPLAIPGQELVPSDEGNLPGDHLKVVFAKGQANLAGFKMIVERAERLPGNVFIEANSHDVDETAGAHTCIGSCLVYVVESVYSPDGEVVRERKRLLSPLEVSVLMGATPGSDLMEAYGAGLMAFQLDFNQALTGTTDPTGGIKRVEEYRFPGTTDGINEEGLNLGLDPWMDPFALMFAGGAMIYDAGEGLREAEESLASSADQAQAAQDVEDAVLSQFQESGVEEVAGRSTIRYTADSPNLPVQEVDDQQFAWNRASVWIDPMDTVLVKHRYEGTATADGQSREFFIEVVNSDFRNPPGCGEMYEPYRRVQRMGGILDDAQMAEIEEAKRQLEEFDRQMAALPADQRRMAERMMGSQMDAVRNLAEGGVIEHVQEIEEILCDPDLKALFGVPGMENDVPDGLIARIQRHLVTLGYEPGNTEGVLDPMTRWAISQFQGDHGLPVTGDPSAELEQALAAEVAARGSN